MRADRLLSILLQLQAHGRLTSRALAKHLEVSERTIHRDMQSLGAAGVPVVAERGARGGWSLMEGYRTNLTGLTESEARALFVGSPSRILADLHLEKASDAALIKLLTALPAIHRRNAELARQRIHIDVTGWNRANEQVPYLPMLQDAVWRERKVRMIYGDDARERFIDPLGLVAKGSSWYLVAAIECGGGGPRPPGRPGAAAPTQDVDFRTYRVSRIREMEMLDDSFTHPENFDLARYWEESAARFRERLPRYAVIIRTDADFVPWVRAMIRFGGIDEIIDDGARVRMAMHFDSEEVARAVLLGCGDRIEVLDPEPLRQSIVATAARIATAAS